MLFIGLWTMADRAGRLEDRPKQIKMEIFPADSVDVDICLSAIAATGMLERYTVDGKRYIQITNFEKHQNPHRDEKPSSIPPQGAKTDKTGATDSEHSASTVQAQCNNSGNPVVTRLNPDPRILNPDSLTKPPLSPRAVGGSVDNFSESEGRAVEALTAEVRLIKKSPILPPVPSPHLEPDAGPDPDPEPPQMLEPDDGLSATQAQPSAVQPSPTGPPGALAVCAKLADVGMPDVSPHHPDLLAMLARGATPEVIVAAAKTAVGKGKQWDYAVGIVKRKMDDAQAMASGPPLRLVHGTHAPPMDAAQAAEQAAAAARAAVAATQAYIASQSQGAAAMPASLRQQLSRLKTLQASPDTPTLGAVVH